MTESQKLTAKQIVNDFYDLFQEKPIIVNTGDREIIIKKNGPVLHPHYKKLQNGNMLFGVGTEYTEHGMLCIGINRWRIIKPNGDILEKENYSNFESEITSEQREISAYSTCDDLLRF